MVLTFIIAVVCMSFGYFIAPRIVAEYDRVTIALKEEIAAVEVRVKAIEERK